MNSTIDFQFPAIEVAHDSLVKTVKPSQVKVHKEYVANIDAFIGNVISTNAVATRTSVETSTE